jgi:ABC-2 type transport system ATP-binding protein
MNILDVIHIHKSYKSSKAVDDISFQLEKGDVFGLIGPNGAGKSTTIGMIAGLTKPDAGEIRYNGVNVESILKQYRRDIGYVPQDIALYDSLTGYDNIQFFGKAYHLSNQEISSKIREMGELLDLPSEVFDRKVAGYSGGMKRKLNIAVALLHNPEIIIMDEPTVGIDVGTRNQILASIIRLSKSGKTILYTGHYLEELEQICNKLCLMDRGHIVAAGSKNELLGDQANRLSLESFYLNRVK